MKKDWALAPEVRFAPQHSQQTSRAAFSSVPRPLRRRSPRTSRSFNFPTSGTKAATTSPRRWTSTTAGRWSPKFTNAHPPLPNITFGLLWHVTGYHILATRLCVSAFAAAALLAVFRLTQNLTLPGSRSRRNAPHRRLPHLVRPKHAGPRRHLRRRLHALGLRHLPAPTLSS